MPTLNPQPTFAIHCDEMLAPYITRETLVPTLTAGLSPEICERIAEVTVRFCSQPLPTKPTPRTICITCDLLDGEGEELDEDHSWYLTAHSWDEPFVLARAERMPKMMAPERVSLR